jgi:hypothetical protein
MATVEVKSSAAADFAFDIMTRGGHRSWREMIAANATMSIEHWYGTSIDGHTWSHPWSASPARIIPQFLSGIRPIAPAWRRIAIHPQPDTKLTQAKVTVPTMRGLLSMEFQRTNGLCKLDLVIPGNTLAEVCLPVPLVGKAYKLSVNRKNIDGVVPTDRPGHLCLPKELGGGKYAVVAAISVGAGGGGYGL